MEYFQSVKAFFLFKATKNGIMNSFWNTVKPFMTNKEILTDNKIVLNDVHLN